jgi:hypothetical protein
MDSRARRGGPNAWTPCLHIGQQIQSKFSFIVVQKKVKSIWYFADCCSPPTRIPCIICRDQARRSPPKAPLSPLLGSFFRILHCHLSCLEREKGNESPSFIPDFQCTLQGVPKVLTRFCEAISREHLGLHKWHRRQKMRLILKFCLIILFF